MADVAVGCVAEGEFTLEDVGAEGVCIAHILVARRTKSKYQRHVTQTIRGATHFVLRQEQGVWRVAEHRDYWDAAEELYEKMPVVGSLMRWLKRRANS